MLKRNLIAFFKFFFFVFHGISQNTGQTFSFAGDLFASADYKGAALAYQRVLFFDKGEYRSAAYHQLANCFYELGDNEKAAHYYDLAFFSEKNDSIKTELIFKKTSSLFQQEKFKDGITELLNIGDDAPDYIYKKKNFYLGIAYFGLNDPGASEKYFLNCIDSSDQDSKEKLTKQFLLVRKINKHRPETAGIFSMILPGAGQFYSGDIKNGINSLLINAAFVGLGFFIAKTYTPLDATIAVFPWLQRYYTGGVKKSEVIAIQKNNEKRKVVYQNILDIIASAKK